MKKKLQLLCLGIALALLPAALGISGALPTDPQPFVEKKYSNWNGVLRGWISTRWSCDGSFVAWLNRCAAAFEKQHAGVYLEFIPVEEAAMAQLETNGLRPPELLIHSPGVLNGTGLMPLDAPQELLPGLSQLPGEGAMPVAMGGYCWVYNRQQMEHAPRSLQEIAALPRLEEMHAPAVIALARVQQEMQVEEAELPGIDLGLQASAAAQVEQVDALDAFLDGELPCLIVNQRQLARLMRLRDAGRGPDWAWETACACVPADQLLLVSVVKAQDETAAQRAALAREFAAFLCQEECQMELARIGAIPVTGAQPYAAFSPYAALAEQPAKAPVFFPDPFSEYSVRNAAGIVREFLNGCIAAGTALTQLGFQRQG